MSSSETLLEVSIVCDVSSMLEVVDWLLLYVFGSVSAEIKAPIHITI